MATWAKLVGTTLDYLRIGLTGPRLKDESGALRIRSAADDADAALVCGGATFTGPMGDATLDTSGLTAPRTFTLPNQSGRLATKNAIVASASIIDGTLTLDHSVADVFTVSLNADITTITQTNVAAVGRESIVVQFTADGTQRTIDWSGNAITFDSDPVVPATLNEVFEVLLVTQDAGTSYRGYVVRNVVPNVSSGTWTPTVTPITNVESVTAKLGYWSRIGDVVTFGVGLQIDTISTGNLQLLISPPVPSAFTSFFQASGTGAQYQGVTFRVNADTSTGMLALRTNATFTTSQSFTIVGVYLVV